MQNSAMQFGNKTNIQKSQVRIKHCCAHTHTVFSFVWVNCSSVADGLCFLTNLPLSPSFTHHMHLTDHLSHTFTPIRHSAQVSSHDYHLYSYQLQSRPPPPHSRGCCYPCRVNGIPFQQLAFCLWPRRLFFFFYDEVISQDVGLQMTPHHVERIPAVVYGRYTHKHACKGCMQLGGNPSEFPDRL